MYTQIALAAREALGRQKAQTGAAAALIAENYPKLGGLLNAKHIAKVIIDPGST